MNKQPETLAGTLPIHESSLTRTAVNVDAAGVRSVTLTTSALSLRWQSGELQVTHRFSATPLSAMRRVPVRTMRNRP